MSDSIKNDWPWPHFSRAEMACRGTGVCVMVPGFMDRLERLRVAIDKPLIVTSGCRAPDYNDLVSSTGRDGPHTTGRAVDIAVHGALAYDLIRIAILYGFTGIGVAQRGPRARRFIHLDDLNDTDTPGPRPWIWSY